MDIIVGVIEGKLGALVMAISGVVFLPSVLFVFPVMAAIRVSWRWGLLSIFLIGPGTLLCGVLHFKLLKVPFLVVLVSGITSIGLFLARSFLWTFLVGPAYVGR